MGLLLHLLHLQYIIMILNYTIQLQLQSTTDFLLLQYQYHKAMELQYQTMELHYLHSLQYPTMELHSLRYHRTMECLATTPTAHCPSPRTLPT